MRLTNQTRHRNIRVSVQPATVTTRIVERLVRLRVVVLDGLPRPVVLHGALLLINARGR
jgi:hypothetical protein